MTDNSQTNAILPFILINIDITLSKEQLKSLLIKEFILCGAILESDNNENLFTVTKKEKNVFKTLCSIFFSQKNDTTKIQVIIKNSENRYDRLVELKALSGDQISAENLIGNFIKRLIKHSKKIKIIKKTEGFFFNLESILVKEFQEKKKNLYSSIGQYSEENATIIESINKEASNHYEIYKILSQENYELGKSVSIFINDFKTKNSNIEESSKQIPKQMIEITSTIDSTVDSFYNYFNFGKSNNESILKCAKPAVEKFIFNKIYFLLFDIYSLKYQNENSQFLEKQKQVQEQMSIIEIMNYLEIKEKFRCIEDYENNNKSICFLPYKSTIDCINKIEYEQSPKDKLDTLISAGLDLRNTILGCNSKSELNSMDDELPIFIYISTQINLKNAPAEFHLIEDYLKYSRNDDEESKVLTNLKSAILFINNTFIFENKK